ncbi:MAG: nucleotidyl transferase AbiEii/AbiGii toxin family protein [Porticoccaceae bacterium]|jgi:predicted nucleotidyltransferase component of viral defense system|nr:nucleotidyl transferase AbiEii/AbiGii toxin family protein [Porticoccaceae bacterium]
MSLTDQQQREHIEVMSALCHGFRTKGLPMILKGGTALKLCYDLDRFSEDLDFDCAKALNLDSSIKEIFTQLGKGKAHLRNPTIDITKDTKTVRRYRITYGDGMNLKLETSLRGTPNDNDLVEINGILTYRIGKLIQQKLSALTGRTAARDLHDVIYLYEHFPDDYDDEALAEITALYDNQSSILEEYTPAYSEDTILSISDLLQDMSRFIDLYKQRH